MSSKGTPRISLRMDEDLQRKIAETIERRNLWSIGDPWDLSSFVRVACIEKLKKMARSRKRSPRRRTLLAGTIFQAQAP